MAVPDQHPSLPPTPSLTGLHIETRRHFRAMNTDIVITVADWRQSRLLGRAEAFFRDFEARFSRFRPESELCRFNARQEPAFPVSREMMRLLELCRRFARLTGGIFNPLVLDSLEASGYDRSFEALPNQKSRKALSARPVPAFDAISLDSRTSEASLPLELRLDFGGIGKGHAVDLAAGLLADAGDFLIDAGGDIFAAGLSPEGGPWRVDVADPASADGSLGTVELTGEAVATSWTTKRRWRIDRGWANHLIDPRSGRWVSAGVIGATVIAPTAVEADVFAKTALILGPGEGLSFLSQQGVRGLLVLEDGSQRSTPDWRVEGIQAEVGNVT
jgi:thiamine biosynthesis lipoprotein